MNAITEIKDLLAPRRHEAIRESAKKVRQGLRELMKAFGSLNQEEEKMWDEEKQLAEYVAKKKRPSVLAREDMARQVACLLADLESPLTARALQDINAGLAKNPKCPKYTLRKMLIVKLGTVEAVMQHFDANGSGDISFFEFETALKEALDKHDIHQYELLTGVDRFNMRRLFALFDKDGDATLDTIELTGVKYAELQKAQWQVLSIMQQWKVYCERTKDMLNKNEKKEEEVREKNVEYAEFRMKKARDHDFEKARMKLMFKLGVRKMNQLAPFLFAEMGKKHKKKEEEEKVILDPNEAMEVFRDMQADLAIKMERQKKETLGAIKDSGRRIEQALKALSNQQRSLAITRCHQSNRGQNNLYYGF